MKKLAFLILAAGSSSRMGQAKQLLKWKHTTLLGNCIEEVLSVSSKDVYVVLGANKTRVEKEIQKYSITILENLGWKKGLSSSISRGVFEIKKRKNYDGVVFLMADMPSFNRTELSFLIDAFHSKNDIVASKFKNQSKVGVPVVFGKSYFDELLGLFEGNGAKHVLEKHSKWVKEVRFDHDFLDIDTPEEYVKLLSKK